MHFMKVFKTGCFVILLSAVVTLASYATPNAIKEKAPPGTVELVLQSHSVDAYEFNVSAPSQAITLKALAVCDLVAIVIVNEQVNPASFKAADACIPKTIKHDVKYRGSERYWCSLSNYNLTLKPNANTKFLGCEKWYSCTNILLT